MINALVTIIHITRAVLDCAKWTVSRTILLNAEIVMKVIRAVGFIFFVILI